MAQEIKVWGEGTKGLWSFGETIDIPEGFVEVPTGDHFLTRTIKRIAGTCYLRMSRSKKGGYSHPVAILAPGEVVEAARSKAEETEEQRRAKRLKADAYRAQKEDQARAGFKAALTQMLPGIPEAEASAVVGHAFAVGSGRVGRTSGLDLADKLVLAVKAHIRHEHTDYDELLADGRDRAEAREAVRPDVDSLYEQWRQAKDSHARPSP